MSLYATPTLPDELYHFGIKGMKWGIRRYQNEDGTLTPAGKKRYQKETYNELKRKHVKYEGQPYRTSEKFKDALNRKASKIVSGDQVQKLKGLRQKMINASQAMDDFYDNTQAFEEANKRAYKETYDFFEKNDPEYLNDIIKRNDGRIDDLDDFHDFRKVLEGYQDSIWSEEEAKWEQTPEGKASKKSEKEWERAWRAYQSECSNIAKDILGKYGDKKVSLFDSTTYRDLVMNNINFDSILDEK